MARLTSFLLLITAVSLLCPAPAQPASLLLDASMLEIHEDNVNLLLSGAGRPLAEDKSMEAPTAARVTARTPAVLPGGARQGDFSTVARAAVGASTMAGPGLELSLRSEFEQFRFHRFSGLNAATASVATGFVKQFSDLLSFTGTLACRKAWYDQDGLTRNGWGGSFEVLQQTASKFWVAEGLQYERHQARDGMMSYTGRSVSVRSGYRFRDTTSGVVTYRYLLRGLNDGERVLVNSLAVSAARDLARHFRVLVSLEHQRIAADPRATTTGNTLVSLGIGYSY